MIELIFQGDKIADEIYQLSKKNDFEIIKQVHGGSASSNFIIKYDDKTLFRKVVLKQFESKLKSQFK